MKDSVMIVKCAICGKEFDMSQYINYIYTRTDKGKIIKFCGWNCMCRYDKGEDAKKEEKKSLTLTYNGETKNLGQWAKIYKLPYATVYHRYKSGKKPEEILQK